MFWFSYFRCFLLSSTDGMLCVFFPKGFCVFVCVSEWECMCHSSETDLLSLYFKLPCHTPPFATSEGCLFVDIKRFSVSFVIQIIIPISVGFDVYIAALCFVFICLCVHDECTVFVPLRVTVCMHEHHSRYLSHMCCTKIQIFVNNTGFVLSY